MGKEERLSFVNKVPLFLRHSLYFAWYVTKTFFDNKCALSATALSYISLLALVPLLTISLSALASFNVLQNSQEQIIHFLSQHLFFESEVIVEEHLTLFIENVRHLSLLGITLLVIALLFVFSTIEATFNNLWGVGMSRSFLKRLLSFWTVLTLGPLVIVIGIDLSSTIASYVPLYSLITHNSYVSPLISILLASIFFSLFYFTVPNYNVQLYHAFIGGFCAAIIFEICRELFISYITYLPSYQFIYKTLSVLPIFLLWMYVFWSLILYGAQITALLPEWKLMPLSFQQYSHHSYTTLFINTLRTIELLWQDQHKLNKGLHEKDFLSKTHLGGLRLEYVLNHLRQAGFIERAENTRWFLKKDLSLVSLYDVFRALDISLSFVKKDPRAHVYSLSSWHDLLLQKLDSLDMCQKKSLSMSLIELFEKRS